MIHSVVTATVAALLAVTVAGATAAELGAVTTGLGDQNTRFLDDARFASLGIERVRVVVPWDVALTADARAGAWIDLALERGRVPLVAFEKSRPVVCPGTGCHGPSPSQYEAGIAAFHLRWPQITELTPWNEPNHRSQPTYADPGLAAAYYNAARRGCARCLLVAGDVLDGGDLAGWIAAYRQGLDEQPAVWGLHNYYDATYFSSTGVDTLTRETTGDIWLTETGGIVRFTPPGGGGLPYSEQRAADALRWLYALTAVRPRVTRMYIYHWQGFDDNAFDGGLVGPQGQARAGLEVVRENAGPRPVSGSVGEAPVAALSAPGAVVDRGAGDERVVVRVSGKALRLVTRGLRVGGACVSAPRHCTGRLVVALPKTSRARYRPRLRTNFDLRPGRSFVRYLRVSRRVRRALRHRRRLQVTYCVGGMRVCTTVQRRLVHPARG